MAAVLPQGARGAVGSGLACLTFRALWQVLLSWALPGRNEGWELMRRLEVKRVGQRLPFQQHTSHGTPCWRPGLQLTTCLVIIRWPWSGQTRAGALAGGGLVPSRQGFPERPRAGPAQGCP